jgi:hypothetical protein
MKKLSKKVIEFVETEKASQLKEKKCEASFDTLNLNETKIKNSHSWREVECVKCHCKRRLPSEGTRCSKCNNKQFRLL